MRFFLTSLTFAVFAQNVLSAAPMLGATPGVDAMSPFVAFPIDGNKGFVTSVGANSKVGESARPTRIAPGAGSTGAGRRVRSIIGIAPDESSDGGARGSRVVGGGGGGGQVSSGGGVAAAAPVPEPGTTLIGLLILGVCAKGTRSRRSLAALVK